MKQYKIIDFDGKIYIDNLDKETTIKLASNTICVLKTLDYAKIDCYTAKNSPVIEGKEI